MYRGSIAGLPEEHASRKERFAELDTLQPGWEVELRHKVWGGNTEGSLQDGFVDMTWGGCVRRKVSTVNMKGHKRPNAHAIRAVGVNGGGTVSLAQPLMRCALHALG